MTDEPVDDPVDEPVSPHLDRHSLALDLASPMRLPARDTVVPARLFQLGQLVATPGALRLLARFGVAPLTLIQRHVCGDWGDLDDTDRYRNDVALIHGARLFSCYIVSRPTGAGIGTGADTGTGASPDGAGEKIWLITEADRSVTTLLLP